MVEGAGVVGKEVAWEARKGEDLVEMAKGAVVKVEVAMEEV